MTAALLLTLLIASAIDPAEALRGPFRDVRQFIGGALGVQTAEAAPIGPNTSRHWSPPSEAAEEDDAYGWNRVDLKLPENMIQAAFATEFEMADVAIAADVEQTTVPEFAPLPTPAPGGYLLFGLGVTALVSRAWRGRSSSRR